MFFGLGVALLLETISIYYSGPWFWAVFCTVSTPLRSLEKIENLHLTFPLFQVYIIVIVVVSVHAYNIGAVKYDWKILYVVAKFVFFIGLHFLYTYTQIQIIFLELQKVKYEYVLKIFYGVAK